MNTPNNLSAILPQNETKDWWLEVEHTRESEKIPITEEKFFSKNEAL